MIRAANIPNRKMIIVMVVVVVVEMVVEFALPGFEY